jgi:hypothetical protein
VPPEAELSLNCGWIFARPDRERTLDQSSIAAQVGQLTVDEGL